MNKNIECLSFNDDYSRFVVGTNNGFSVYDSNPIQFKFSNNLFSGGLKIVKVFNRSRIVAFVGSGTNPEYPTNKLILWDAEKQSAVATISVKEEIENVIPLDTFLAVVTNNSLLLFKMNGELTQVRVISLHTSNCVSIKMIKNKLVLIYTDPNDSGKILIQKYDCDDCDDCDDVDITESTLISIPVSKTKIEKIVLNSSGKTILVSSENDTYFKLFDTSTGDLIKQMSRSTFSSEIMDFDYISDDDMLCVITNNASLHFLKSESTLTTVQADWINSGKILTILNVLSFVNHKLIL